MVVYTPDTSGSRRGAAMSRVCPAAVVAPTLLERDALGITPPMAVSIGSVCQALRKKIADCQGHDHANGRWSSLLASLIFIETVLIGVSLLIVNRVYWSLVQAGTAGLPAMAASLITVVAIFGFGASCS